jgi:hypothetical protein
LRAERGNPRSAAGCGAATGITPAAAVPHFPGDGAFPP